ncbi:hypothetical protein RhiJN_20950 [Ceratobasidium sp. AG-Ba]|nr:hypothetical protein RhiJN_20950 [Ceratobasidium sp. AG-Ba]
MTPNDRHSVNTSSSGMLKLLENPSRGMDHVKICVSKFSRMERFQLDFSLASKQPLDSEFCDSIPTLSRFSVWKEACPLIRKVSIFNIVLQAK